MTTGRRGRRRPNEAWPEGLPLGVGRVVAGLQSPERSSERRETEFGYGRLYIPSLVLDYSFLLLRQAGARGDELFVVWAGAIAGRDAFVTSLVIPKSEIRGLHGEIPVDVAGRVFESLDSRDLIPLAQLHSHPAAARLSEIDRTRPLVAVPGFLSIIIPDFGFTDPYAPGAWGVYEYVAGRQWNELNREEKRSKILIDDAVIRVE
jgi:hypothetical protein